MWHLAKEDIGLYKVRFIKAVVMEVNYFKIKTENLDVNEWAGGKTKQLYIFPEVSSYAKRDFMWRLSSATVEAEISEFTVLEDYNRLLMILEGNVELNHNDTEIVNLNKYDQTEFDGSNNTISKGKAKDFNLMLRKDQANGSIFRLAVPDDEEYVYSEVVGFFKEENFTFVIYCDDFAGEISVEGIFDEKVESGDTIVVNFAGYADNFDIKFKSKSSEETNVVISEIFY